MKRYLSIFVLFLFIVLKPAGTAADETVGPHNDKSHTTTIKVGDQALQPVEETDEYYVVQIRGQYKKINKVKDSIAYEKFMKEFTEKGETIKRRKAEIKGNPNNPLLRIALGNYYTLWGMYSEALKEYEEAIKLEPHDERILRGAAALAFQCFETEKTIVYAEAAVKLNPEDYFLNKALAIAYEANGNYVKTDAVIKKLKKMTIPDKKQVFGSLSLFEYGDPVMKFLGDRKIRDKYKTVVFVQGTVDGVDSRGNSSFGDVESIIKK